MTVAKGELERVSCSIHFFLMEYAQTHTHTEQHIHIHKPVLFLRHVGALDRRNYA